MKPGVFTARNVVRDSGSSRANMQQADHFSHASAPSNGGHIRRYSTTHGGYVRPIWFVVEEKQRDVRTNAAHHVPGSGPGCADGTSYWAVWSLN